jgi:hypothetical protein
MRFSIIAAFTLPLAALARPVDLARQSKKVDSVAENKDVGYNGKSYNSSYYDPVAENEDEDYDGKPYDNSHYDPAAENKDVAYDGKSYDNSYHDPDFYVDANVEAVDFSFNQVAVGHNNENKIHEDGFKLTTDDDELAFEEYVDTRSHRGELTNTPFDFAAMWTLTAMPMFRTPSMPTRTPKLRTS